MVRTTGQRVAAGSWAVLALCLVLQSVALPWISRTLVADFPGLETVASTLLVLAVLCFVPVEVAAVVTALAARRVGAGASGPSDDGTAQRGTGADRRTQVTLAAAAALLLVGAACGVGTMLWATAAVSEYGMNPGIGLAMLAFVGACVVAAGLVLVWRAQVGAAPRDPTTLDR